MFQEVFAMNVAHGLGGEWQSVHGVEVERARTWVEVEIDPAFMNQRAAADMKFEVLGPVQVRSFRQQLHAQGTESPQKAASSRSQFLADALVPDQCARDFAHPRLRTMGRTHNLVADEVRRDFPHLPAASYRSD